MILPIDPKTNFIYSSPSNSKLKWNGYAWDRIIVESSSSDTNSYKILTERSKEVPEGEIDGYNFIFNLLSVPEIDTEMVFLNGQLLKKGEDNDYLIYDRSIYFIEPPYEGSNLVCVYQTQTKTEIKNEIASKVEEKIYSVEEEISVGDELIFLNGLLLSENVDYSIESNIIEFKIDILENDIIIVHYFSKRQ
jgi:hypothetical protein